MLLCCAERRLNPFLACAVCNALPSGPPAIFGATPASCLQSFEARQQRDRASEVPPEYRAPDFTTSALQHTNVKLSWDAGDDERKRVLQKRLNDDAIKENDFKVSPAGCLAIPAQCCCSGALRHACAANFPLPKKLASGQVLKVL